jgi:lipopolysaccharide export LptBFGC system permease protein LptF
MESRLKEIIIFVCVLFGLIILGTIFNSLYLNPTGNVISNQVNPEKNTEQIHILNHEMGNDTYGNLFVSGIVGNDADKNLSYVEIKVKFYDKEGNVLKTTSESINDLKDKEKWKFESIYPSFDTSNVASYEISVGEVW